MRSTQWFAEERRFQREQSRGWGVLGSCLGEAELCPQLPYVAVLTPRTSGCDCTRRWCLLTDDRVNMGLAGLIPRDRCPYKKRKFGHRETPGRYAQRDSTRGHGEGGHLHAKERPQEKAMRPAPHPQNGDDEWLLCEPQSAELVLASQADWYTGRGGEGRWEHRTFFQTCVKSPAARVTCHLSYSPCHQTGDSLHPFLQLEWERQDNSSGRMNCPVSSQQARLCVRTPTQDSDGPR